MGLFGSSDTISALLVIGGEIVDYTKFISGDHVQRQDSLNDQLGDLIPVADKLGLYDASDLLKTLTSHSLNILKKDTPVWHVDFETGEIERGKVFGVQYENGKLLCFSVEFENDDFDEFYGEAYGTSFFPSEKSAEAALLRGE